MNRLPILALLLFFISCSSAPDTTTSLYDGPDVADSFQDPGAKILHAEVSRLPFKHIEWEFKFNDVEIRRMTKAGDHLYIETNNNQLIAVDRFIGEVKWIYHVDSNRPLDFPPVVAQGVPETIRVLEEDLLRINRAIDDTVRSKGPGEEVKKLQKERAEKREKLKVSRFGDNVYFLSQQELYCLDRISGTLRWTRRMEFVPSAQPTATQFYIFVSAANKARVYVLNVKQRGSVAEYFRADINSRHNQITARPAFEDPVLYFVSHDGKVYFYSVSDRDGVTPLKTQGPIRANPVLFKTTEKSGSKGEFREKKILFVGSSDNAFYAVDGASGQLDWKYECGAPIFDPAVAIGNTVYVKSEGGALFAFDIFPVHRRPDGSVMGAKRNGSLRWKLPLGERFLMKGEDYVYVLGPDQEIYAIKEMSGHIVGRYPTKRLHMFVTNTSDDLFYCANSSGYIYALRESSERY